MHSSSREPVPMELEQTPKAVIMSRGLLFDILLASAANAINQADRNIMPIAVIPMAAAFDWSMLQRGLILSSFAYGYILTQLPGGWIATQLAPLKLLLVAALPLVIPAWSAYNVYTGTPVPCTGNWPPRAHLQYVHVHVHVRWYSTQ